VTEEAHRLQMRRFSLRTFVVAAPLVCGLVIAVWSYHHHKRRTDVLDSYHRVLANGGTLPLPWLEDVLGESAAKSRVRVSANDHSDLIFDGESRVVQIERTAISDGAETGDGISLYTFGVSCGMHCLHAPIGARIDSVEFTEDAIEVTLHGELRMGSFGHNIDEQSPETYRIEWLPKSSPNVENIYSVIWNRHKHEVVRRPGS